MKTPQHLVLLLLALCMSNSCNVSNPRVIKKAVVDSVRGLGELSFSDLAQSLERQTDDSSLEVGATAEGEATFELPRKLSYQSGGINCSITYTKAKYKQTVIAPLSLGLEVHTELTPEDIQNTTVGTSGARELCESELTSRLPIMQKSTLVPALERKLVSANLKEFLQEIENSCEDQAMIGTERCLGLEYEITKSDYFSAGGRIEAFQIKLEFDFGGMHKHWQLIFSAQGKGVLSGGVLSIAGDSELLGLHAGSLGVVRELELSNLR